MEKKVLVEAVRAAFEAVRDRGEEPSVRNVYAICGGNYPSVSEIVRELKEELEQSQKTQNETLRQRVSPALDRVLSVFSMVMDESVRSLQSAHDAAMGAVMRDRDTQKQRADVAEAALREEEEQIKNLQFRLKGAETDRDAHAQARVELEAQVRRLLEEASKRDSHVAALEGELRKQADDRMARAQEKLEEVIEKLTAVPGNGKKRQPA